MHSLIQTNRLIFSTKDFELVEGGTNSYAIQVFYIRFWSTPKKYVYYYRDKDTWGNMNKKIRITILHGNIKDFLSY